jgi:hypothetical protein
VPPLTHNEVIVPGAWSSSLNESLVHRGVTDAFTSGRSTSDIAVAFLETVSLVGQAILVPPFTVGQIIIVRSS